MTAEPNTDLADKTRAYLTAHGWTRGEGGEAGALWTAPTGQQVAVGHWLAQDEPMFRHLVTVIGHIECRQAPIVAAEILDPDAAEPAYTFAPAWTWTRVEGTGVEILADTEARLCARQADGVEQEIRAKIAAALRRAADGRREYARTAVKDADEQDREELAARAYESAAGIAESPLNVLDLIPVHWWTDEEHAAVEPPDARKPPVLNVTRDRHCGHCGRDNATASAYETPLCHTDDPGLPDCYRRVTVYSEQIGALTGLEPLPAGVEGIVGRGGGVDSGLAAFHEMVALTEDLGLYGDSG